MTTERHLILLAFAAACLSGFAPALARPFDPSAWTWDNPEFVRWFTGTYAADGNISPQIDSDEQALFQRIAPLMESDPRAAAGRIQAHIENLEGEDAVDYSAALDYTMGSLYLQSGDTGEAVRFYRRAVERFPTFQRAYQNLGLAEVQQGRYGEALPYLTRAVELGADNGILWGLIGFAYLNVERPTQALAAYQQALLFQPDSRDWKLGKLNALLDTGNPEAAVALIREMLKEDREQPQLWMQQANAYLSMGQPLEAAINLEWVARNGHATGQVLVLLGDIYLNDGMVSLAARTYQRALATGEAGPDRLLRAAENLLARGAETEAVRFLDALRDASSGRLDPEQSLKVLSLEARLALRRGDLETARERLEMVVSRDPLNGSALVALGDTLRQLDQPEAAALQYERALEDSETRVQALLALGRLLVAQRRYKPALDYLSRAQELEPRPYLADYIDQLEAVVD